VPKQSAYRSYVIRGGKGQRREAVAAGMEQNIGSKQMKG
jgi:hypothetical protein